MRRSSGRHMALWLSGATPTGISVKLCPNGNRFWCPESSFADTVTFRSRKSHPARIRARSSSCATLALVQTDSEPDPPCLHAANKRSSRSGGPVLRRNRSGSKREVRCQSRMSPSCGSRHWSHPAKLIASAPAQNQKRKQAPREPRAKRQNFAIRDLAYWRDRDILCGD